MTTPTSKSLPPSKHTKIDSYSAWGCTWCAGGALTNFPCKLRVKFFYSPWEGGRCTHCTPWLRLRPEASATFGCIAAVSILTAYLPAQCRRQCIAITVSTYFDLTCHSTTCLGEMSICDGRDHFRGRNGEFCVDPLPGLLSY